MSVKSATEEIRRSRRIKWISDYPVEAEILSTDGNSKHVITGDTETPLWCQTCEGNGYRHKCWATKRVEDALLGRVKAIEARQVTVAEPKKLQPRSWLAIYQESGAASKATTDPVSA